MELSESTKENIRLALESHKKCVHTDAAMCYTLTLCEVEILEGELLSEEMMEECRNFMADAVLEGLILKGIVEVVGVSEDGEFMVGLTDAGEAAYDDHIGDGQEDEE